MPRARKKAIEVEYEVFDGTNFQELFDWTQCNFRWLITESNPEVYDKLHETWIKVFKNDIVIKGSKGEFYPHEGELFYENYDLL